MSIGIIGAGSLGSNAARLLAQSGISATIANGRGPESLAGLVGELGPSIKAGTVKEAASADIVLVAVRWVDLEKAVGGLPAWNSRIVIDGTNPARCLWHQGDRSRRQAFQRGVPRVRSGRTRRQDIQPSRRQRPAGAGGIGRPARPVLFGRRCRREGRGSQDHRTDRLFSGRPRRARCGRTFGLAAVRFACGHQFCQDLTVRGFAPNQGTRSIGLERRRADRPRRFQRCHSDGLGIGGSISSP